MAYFRYKVVKNKLISSCFGSVSFFKEKYHLKLKLLTRVVVHENSETALYIYVAFGIGNAST